jgi:uncharacterized protein
MTVSMYQASVPVFIRVLSNLDSVLKKAAAHVESKRIDPAIFIQARLYPDMFPLVRQVQIASDNAKGGGARLAGVEPPKFEDNEQTFPELAARIQKTIDFLHTLSPEQIDGSETRQVHYKTPYMDVVFKGVDYLHHFAIPNVFFHTTIAYAILRHNGVEIGKQDFLGAL